MLREGGANFSLRAIGLGAGLRGRMMAVKDVVGDIEPREADARGLRSTERKHAVTGSGGTRQ